MFYQFVISVRPRLRFFSGSFAVRCSYPIPVPLLISFATSGQKRSRWPRFSPVLRRAVVRSRLFTGRPPGLPSSRVAPLNTCNGLRLRWEPEYLPLRIQACCLPPAPRCRLSFRFCGIYPIGPRLYLFRSSIQSLCPCFLRLQTPVTGFARGVLYRPGG